MSYSEDFKTIYEQAVAPPPPCPPSKPAPRQSMPSSEQGRMDKADEETRMILKKRIFEPYFESELGKVFLDKLVSSIYINNINCGKGVKCSVSTYIGHGRRLAE